VGGWGRQARADAQRILWAIAANADPRLSSALRGSSVSARWPGGARGARPQPVTIKQPSDRGAVDILVIGIHADRIGAWARGNRHVEPVEGPDAGERGGNVGAIMPGRRRTPVLAGNRRRSRWWTLWSCPGRRSIP
jgi:hypothetical protein